MCRPLCLHSLAPRFCLLQRDDKRVVFRVEPHCHYLGLYRTDDRPAILIPPGHRAGLHPTSYAYPDPASGFHGEGKLAIRDQE